MGEERNMARTATTRTSRGLTGLVGIGLLIIVFGALCATAQARVPIYGFDTATSTTKAGGHPDVEIRVEVGTFATDGVEECFCNAVRDITVHTPRGLIGVPGNIPECSASEFAGSACPTDSQIGVVAVRLFAPLNVGGAYFVQPLYNMEPRPGQLALLATLAPLLQTPIYTVVESRTESDYGLDFKTFGVPKLIPPNEITQFTWGVPADPKHDALRWSTESFSKSAQCWEGSPLAALAEDRFPTEYCTYGAPQGTSAIAPPKPFLVNPTACEGPLKATLDISGYENSEEHAESPWPATTGCDQLGFSPSLSATPTTTEADSPSGLNVVLKVPQSLSPSASSPSEIRGTTLRLPPGLTIAANMADGKSACADEEAAFGSRDQGHCPDYSKIGTLTIDSSALPGPLPGYIYLGKPLPGNRYRVFLVADGFSLHVKLLGIATTDPKTGQLTIALHELPESPFQEFRLHLFGAERGLLATPTHCGKYAVKTEFEPWDNALPDQESVQFFEIAKGPDGGPCPGDVRPFAPKMLAGVTDVTGGAHTTFVFDLKRSDGDQSLSAVEISTPPGFSATLAGVPYCPESALAAAEAASASGLAEQLTPSCPAASKVGESGTGVGAGSRPASFPGSVYLAGPYKGAPLSLAVITPAVAGPYDLGDVVVRVALDIDQTDAHVTAVSDPLPQIVGGIPLRLREIGVLLDRPSFALNPTNCSTFAVGADVSGDQGGTADLSNPFQVANCGALPYRPKLALRLTGGVHRRGHPAIHASFKAQPGEANSRVISVTLPKGELLDNSHLGNVCTAPQFKADACDASTVLGSAEVRSPLLDAPLKGRAYLRASTHRLPDLVLDLRGQIHIVLAARVDAVEGRLRATFEDLPDAPISSVSLDLQGGSKGLVQNSHSLCGGPKKATVKMVGQNGRPDNLRSVLEVRCAGKGRHKRHRRHPSRARRGA
jgi:hypothetical protein